MSKNIKFTLVYKYNSLNMKLNNKIIKNSVEKVFYIQKKYQAIETLRELDKN